MGMNQILVTEKLYVTPGVKRKRVFYKTYFFLAILCVCLLFSAYIYAEYDKSKAEEAGKTFLNLFSQEQGLPLNEEEKHVWTFVLGEGEAEEIIDVQQEELQEQLKQEVHYSEGLPYYAIATISIPKIDVEYAVFSRTSDELLKMSPTKIRGPEPNEVGNLCIVGHNYKNKSFFSKVPTLEIGDEITITDQKGRTISYTMYDKYEVDPSDTSCLIQNTDGKKEVTLITCTNDTLRRVITKYREKK